MLSSIKKKIVGTQEESLTKSILVQYNFNNDKKRTQLLLRCFFGVRVQKYHISGILKSSSLSPTFEYEFIITVKVVEAAGDTRTRRGERTNERTQYI